MLNVALQRLRLYKLMNADPRALANHRDARLRELVTHAYRTTAYYRALLDGACVRPEAIRGVDDLPLLPLSTRGDLQGAGSDALTSSAFGPDALVTEKTSGSSGRPLEVRLDRGWVAVRNAMFLRALGAAGYRPGRRMLLISGDATRDRGFPLHWRYMPFDTPANRLIESVNTFQPWLLYGWVTPLRRFAEHVRDHGGLVHRPSAIVTTAEALDESTRSLLSEHLGGEVFQIYGLTEMGALAWECNAHRGMHTAQDTAIVECVEGRLVLTNLMLRGMPLLRYDCGDLANWQDTTAAACACGCGYRRLARVEGRTVDCVRLRDGRVLSPYQLTLALEEIASLQRYQVTQVAVDRFEVGYVLRAGAPDAAAEIRTTLACLLGDEVAIDAQPRASLDPEHGRKFRVVESRYRPASAANRPRPPST